MADVSIDASTTTKTARGARNVVFTSYLVGYAFHIDNSGILSYCKTSDGGASWAASVTFGLANTTTQAFDVWYDQWTPGDSGRIIHCWSFDSTANLVEYNPLDTTNDTFGTNRTAFTGVSVVGGVGSFCSGTKTRSGYLYCAFDLDAGAERGIVRSTDGGPTWSANLSTTFVEATTDRCYLFPATGTGDDNDCWAIYQDASADALTMKMWDSSAAAQVESSTVQTMVELSTDFTGQCGFSGTIRASDGTLILVSCSERDTATADMQVWFVTAVTAASQTGITAKTNITTDIDDNYNPAVFIDNNTNNIYVAYNGKRDGSETMATSTKVYYTSSTDDAVNWTAGDTTYMQGTAAAVNQVWTPLSGNRFYVVWRTATALTGNFVGSLDVTALIKLLTEPMTPARWEH